MNTHTHTPQKHRHTRTLFSHQTPLSSFFSRPLPLSSSLLPFFLLHYPLLIFPPRPSNTDLSHQNAPCLKVYKSPLDQMRTGNEVCCCWQYVSLICCRGGSCDSRTCRRNLNRAPIDWKSFCRRVCLVLSVSVPVFFCVCHELSVFFQCLCAERRSDLQHFVGPSVSMRGEGRGRFTGGLTAKVERSKGASNFNITKKTIDDFYRKTIHFWTVLFLPGASSQGQMAVCAS